MERQDDSRLLQIVQTQTDSSAEQSRSSTTEERTYHSDSLPYEWGVRLLSRLTTIYPTLGSMLPDDQARIDWIDLWCECCSGMNSVDIRRALKRCAMDQSDFCPKPGKFVEMSKPTAEELGLPTDQQAFRSWQRVVHNPPEFRDWSKVHPAVAWCHQYLAADYFVLRTRTEKDQMKAFLEYWEEAKQIAATTGDYGTFLPSPEKASKPTVKPHKKNEASDRAKAAESQIERLRSLLSGEEGRGGCQRQGTR